MSLKYCIAFAACLMVTVVSASAVEPVQREPLPPAGQPLKAHPVHIVPNLSKQECEGLGGKVYKVAGCDSGQICRTVDQDGVLHAACLTPTEGQ